MIENKKNLWFRGVGTETDLELNVEVVRCFGWKVEDMSPYPKGKDAFVVQCSRDTDMKNYEQIKQLEDSYNKLADELSITNSKIIRQNGKIKDLRVLPSVFKVLSFLAALFFIALGTSVPSLFVIGGFFAAIFILLLVLGNNKKSAIASRYDELDSIKLKAKSLV